MITLIILLILFYGAYSGYKNGTLLELLKAIGYGIVLVYTFDYYRQLSDFLSLMIPYPTVFAPETNPFYFHDEGMIFSMDRSYYDIIAFGTIFVVGWIIVKLLTRLMSYTILRIKTPEPINSIGGSVLGFMMNYLGVYFILFFLTTIPLNIIQENLGNNFVAEKMVTSTPVVSNKFHEKFIVSVNQEAIEDRPLMEIPLVEEENTEEETSE